MITPRAASMACPDVHCSSIPVPRTPRVAPRCHPSCPCRYTRSAIGALQHALLRLPKPVPLLSFSLSKSIPACRQVLSLSLTPSHRVPDRRLRPGQAAGGGGAARGVPHLGRGAAALDDLRQPQVGAAGRGCPMCPGGACAVRRYVTSLTPRVQQWSNRRREQGGDARGRLGALRGASCKPARSVPPPTGSLRAAERVTPIPSCHVSHATCGRAPQGERQRHAACKILVSCTTCLLYYLSLSVPPPSACPTCRMPRVPRRDAASGPGGGSPSQVPTPPYMCRMPRATCQPLSRLPILFPPG